MQIRSLFKNSDDLKFLEALIKKEAAENEIKEISIAGFEVENMDYAKGNFSPKNVSLIKLSFKHLKRVVGEHTILSTIGKLEAEKFLIEVKKNAPKGYRNYHRSLKASMNRAKDWGFIKDNPFAKIKLPPLQRMKPKYINRKELWVILSTRIFDNRTTIADIVLYCFYTGCRVGEAVNQRCKNIDLERMLLTVGDEEYQTKSRKVRQIPISIEIKEMLKYHLSAEDDYLFRKKDGSMFDGSHVSKVFKKGCRAAGIDEGIHFHSLRASFASNLVNAGVSIFLIKELLGHSSLVTTQIYSAASMEALKEAVGKL